MAKFVSMGARAVGCALCNAVPVKLMGPRGGQGYCRGGHGPHPSPRTATGHMQVQICQAQEEVVSGFHVRNCICSV